MKLTPEQLLLSGVLDVRSRFVRLISCLDDVALTAPPGERQVVRSVRIEVEKHLIDFISRVDADLDAAQIEADDDDDPTNWSSASLAGIADRANRAFLNYRSDHDLVYPFIRASFPVPDDLNHFMFRALDMSLLSPIHRASVAIYTSQYPTWESSAVLGMEDTSASEYEIQPPAVANILVPLAETRSPSRWPLLIHELGHLLAPFGRRADLLRTQELVAADIEPDSALDDSLAELLADAIAERTMGRAFAVSLAREGYLQSFNKHSRAGGPTIKQRLENLKFGPEVAAALPPAWKLDGSKFDSSTNKKEEVMSDADLIQVVDMTARIQTAKVTEANEASVNSARELMRLSQPTPAVPFDPTPSQEVFDEAAAGTADKEALEWLFRSVAETPLTDAEILEAHWAEDVERPLQVLKELIVAPVTAEEKSQLARVDLLLSRSLQAAAVHRWLVENDVKIESNLQFEKQNFSPTPNTPPMPAESSPLSDVHLARRLTFPVADARRLVVRPLIDPSQLGGTTIDLRLGTEWETLRTSRFRSLDPGDNRYVVQDLLNESVQEFRLTAGEEHGLVLHPGELLLALTLEYLRLPHDLWGQLEGRSTWARVGLQVHATAGMVDAGFQGYLTLELQNTGRLPIVLYPGLRVGQMAFFPVPNVARPYQNKEGAAYSDQAQARTAFTKQHEHQARYSFVFNENNLEADRRRRLEGMPSTENQNE